MEMGGAEFYMREQLQGISYKELAAREKHAN
jgi:hypothetical protein